jgi:hypothetical protein
MPNSPNTCICYKTQFLYNSVSHPNRYNSTAHYLKPQPTKLSICTSVTKHNPYTIQSHTLTTITVQPIIPNTNLPNSLNIYICYQTQFLYNSVSHTNHYNSTTHYPKPQPTKLSQYLHMLPNTIPIQISLTH